MSYAANVKTFFLEETDRAKLGLRRYHLSENGATKCPLGRGDYHNALVYIGEITSSVSEPDEYGRSHRVFHDQPEVPHDDPRWPTHCACGFAFTADDAWQVWTEAILRRTDTGADETLRDAPPGAMWNAWWMGTHYSGPDGRCLVVKLPNGHDWMIDGIASNCDAPCQRCGAPMHQHSTPTCRYIDPVPHKCWVRHGEPPVLTVDKNGVTCGAGAGSILSGDYHGFLRNGVFEP